MVHLYETGQINGVVGLKKSPEKTIQEVLVISGTPKKDGEGNEDEELLKKYNDDIYKMSRADFIMS